jgi:hypothetical protein
MYLYSCDDDSLGTGNPCPNFSKFGVPKGVLIINEDYNCISAIKGWGS